MTAAVLEARNLTVGYRAARRRHTLVLDGVNVALRSGELVSVLGPNGSGKSTLLRTLAGTQPALGGSVSLTSQDLGKLSATAVARRLAVVLTEPVDAGWLRVYDLVALGRYPHTGWFGNLSPDDHAIVRWALDLTGSSALASRPVAELSDGERQRVLITRALAQDPAVMVLDEPTAFVDLPRRVELTGLLRRLTRTTGLAVLLATHDLHLALRTSDTVWLLDDAGDLAVGAPEDLVLRGAFDRAFGGRDLTFDMTTGGFRTREESGATAAVIGSGPVRIWTGHALERAGLRLVDDPGTADVEVHVRGEADAWTWHAFGEDLVATCASLQSLVGALRHRGTGRAGVVDGPGPSGRGERRPG